jgi:hypothetical protein
MTKNRAGAVVWRTSRYSNGNGGNCVEVADGVPGLVPVRDSKNRTGPVLMIRNSAWIPFIDSLTGNRPR